MAEQLEMTASTRKIQYEVCDRGARLFNPFEISIKQEENTGRIGLESEKVHGAQTLKEFLANEQEILTIATFFKP